MKINTYMKLNPTYNLILNEKVIFSGYKHECIEYMVKNKISSRLILLDSNFFKGEEFIVVKPEKYINAEKYKGLLAVIVNK